MSDPVNAPVNALGGASYDGAVTVREADPQGMITLRGDLLSEAFCTAVSEIAGVDVPAARSASVRNGRGLLWMSPNELMLLCRYADVDRVVARLDEALAGQHHLAVDVSDARAMFELRGRRLREVLAKVSPADMSPETLTVGEMRRTRLAQVAGAFWLEHESQAHVICFRSVAEYVFDLLRVSSDYDAAIEVY